MMVSETGTASHWNVTLDVQGVRINLARHGKVGTRPWTKMTAPYTTAFEIWTEHHLRDEPHPDIAIRSHHHRYADTYHAYPTRLIQTGAWQLATAYVHKVAPNSLADIGGCIITIRDGEPSVQPMLYRAEPKVTWRAK